MSDNNKYIDSKRTLFLNESIELKKYITAIKVKKDERVNINKQLNKHRFTSFIRRFIHK